jgi:hypothetical protein
LILSQYLLPNTVIFSNTGGTSLRRAVVARRTACSRGGKPPGIRRGVRAVDEGSRVLDAGAVCIEAGRWAEINGAFWLREAPCVAEVYVHAWSTDRRRREGDGPQDHCRRPQGAVRTTQED